VSQVLNHDTSERDEAHQRFFAPFVCFRPFVVLTLLDPTGLPLTLANEDGGESAHILYNAFGGVLTCPLPILPYSPFRSSPIPLSYWTFRPPGRYTRIKDKPYKIRVPPIRVYQKDFRPFASLAPLTPAPFLIRHSPFAIRHSPFAIHHYNANPLPGKAPLCYTWPEPSRRRYGVITCHRRPTNKCLYSAQVTCTRYR
jgi:hypothetical protein